MIFKFSVVRFVVTQQLIRAAAQTRRQFRVCTIIINRGQQLSHGERFSRANCLRFRKPVSREFDRQRMVQTRQQRKKNSSRKVERYTLPETRRERNLKFYGYIILCLFFFCFSPRQIKYRPFTLKPTKASRNLRSFNFDVYIFLSRFVTERLFAKHAGDLNDRDLLNI